MKSIKEIFVVGHGPSSSHTMGPANATDYILKKYQNINNIKVILHGSLALTGKGHLTDYIIDLKLKDIPHQIEFDMNNEKLPHPNTMDFEVTTKDGEFKERILSIGGGSIKKVDEECIATLDVYPHSTLKEILNYCSINCMSLSDYVLKYEGEDIKRYLSHIIHVMTATIIKGIKKEGELPGDLHLKRKAKDMYERWRHLEDPISKRNYEFMMAIAATATSEENASGGIIVIAPTCGSSGVIPGVLAYLFARKTPYEDIIKGLMVAGLIGQLCKTNGSISGAEAGCQAEIGVACAMGAALISSARGMENRKIAQCAEIALEHSLGLTCDPVKGYVQIPCIERCAMYALKAKNAFTLSRLIPSEYGKISFDDSVKTMLSTGKDIPSGYKETSKEGLSKLFK